MFFTKITVSSSTIITKGLEKHSLEASGLWPMLQCGEYIWLSVPLSFFCVPQDLLIALSIAHLLTHFQSSVSSTPPLALYEPLLTPWPILQPGVYEWGESSSDIF